MTSLDQQQEERDPEPPTAKKAPAEAQSELAPTEQEPSEETASAKAPSQEAAPSEAPTTEEVKEA